MGQRGCGSCHCLGGAADVASNPGRQHLGSMWSSAALRLGDVQGCSCSWDPLWCRGTGERVGLVWAVIWEAAGLAGACTAAGAGMRNADVRSEQETSGHA